MWRFKETICLVLIILLCAVATFAGTTGKIVGTVTDEKTGEILPGANVIVVGTSLGASSDIEGYYSILNVPPGMYKVKCTYIGYKTKVVSDVRVSIDKSTEVQFSLGISVIEGEEVVIVAHKSKMLEPDRTATKQVYFTSEVSSIEGVTNISDIVDLQADVSGGHFRGGRTGETNYLVDGVSIVNPYNNETTFNPIANAFEQVEVITSGFSAEYGNAQSGVVNMVMKEGGVQWVTKIEAVSDLPRRRHFGPGYFTPEYQQFYNRLVDVDEWLEEVPGKGQSWAEYENMSRYIISNRAIPDSMMIADLARREFLSHYDRIGGPDYINAVNGRVNVTLSGPITNNVRLFSLIQLGRSYGGDVPNLQPNYSWQVLSNLVYELDVDNKLKLMTILNRDQNISNEGTSLDPYGQARRENSTTTIGLSWKHTFGPRSFMDINLNFFNDARRTRGPILELGDYRDDFSQWIYNPFTGHGITRNNLSYQDRETQKLSFKADYTAQLNRFHLFKTGLQLGYFNFNYFNVVNSINESSYNDESFKKYPLEGAVYLQDKMEFEGMIANVGIRYDFYQYNTSYYNDLYSPLRNPDYDPVKPYLERGDYYDETKALTGETGLIGVLQPRIGLSFPISTQAVFHVNYTKSFQRSDYDLVYRQREDPFSGQLVRLGNPRIKPEEVKSYDVGLVYTLPLGFFIDVSAYYKDWKNLNQTAYYYDENQISYETYFNQTYANSKGFHINLEKSGQYIQAMIRYNWQQTLGKASQFSDGSGASYFYEQPVGTTQPAVLPDPEDYPLSYDRKHRIVANLLLKATKNTGPEVFGIKPLANMKLSTTFRFQTGTPYTKRGSKGVKFNARTRNEYLLSGRISRDFRIGSSTIVTAYLEGYNLLNLKQYANFVYTDSWYSPKLENNDPAIYRNDEQMGPYWSDNSLNVYKNSPRYFRYGMIFTF